MVNGRAIASGLLLFFMFSLLPALAQECTQYWVCTDWSFCMGSGVQMRSCTDVNRCGSDTDKPAETQTCSPEPVREVVSPAQYDGTVGVTGLITSGTPTVLAVIAAALSVLVFIAYRKSRDLRTVA